MAARHHKHADDTRPETSRRPNTKKQRRPPKLILEAAETADRLRSATPSLPDVGRQLRTLASRLERIEAYLIVAGQALNAGRRLRRLHARIARLRECPQRGDPDMRPDEIQAAIEKAEQKRCELAAAQQPASKEGSRVLVALPQAAAVYRSGKLVCDDYSGYKARLHRNNLCVQPT